MLLVGCLETGVSQELAFGCLPPVSQANADKGMSGAGFMMSGG